MSRVAVIRDKSIRAALNDWRWRRRLRELQRADFVARAEAESMRRLGRSLTPVELERVLRRYSAGLAASSRSSRSRDPLR